MIEWQEGILYTFNCNNCGRKYRVSEDVYWSYVPEFIEEKIREAVQQGNIIELIIEFDGHCPECASPEVYEEEILCRFYGLRLKTLPC